MFLKLLKYNFAIYKIRNYYKIYYNYIQEFIIYKIIKYIVYTNI